VVAALSVSLLMDINSLYKQLRELEQERNDGLTVIEALKDRSGMLKQIILW
jgi:hypothetical protein